MVNSRSPLDALNLGRQRRSQASLEELSRTLDSLENRFEQARIAADRDSPAPQTREQAPHRARPAAQAEDRIAAEIKALRAELRHQMGTGLKREFQSLRQEIGLAEQHELRELSRELERLNRAIGSLGGQSDPRAVEMLRLELDEMKQILGRLAREESVKSVDRRWDEFDRRWSAFEERVASGPAGGDFGPLAARLEQIASSVDNLPESLALKSLDDKVRTLAGVIERLSRSQDEMAGAAFAALDARLDEISRAIAAAPVREVQPVDADAVERIEARLSLLGRQLEDAAMARDGADLAERLTLLQDRMDDFVLRAEAPEQALESLTRQMQEIAARLDSVSPPLDEARITDTIDDRLSLFSDTLAERLRQSEAAAQAESAKQLEAIEQRIAALADRIDAAPAGRLDGSALEAIESRLDEIARRIETGPAGVDAESIRMLEAEIATLTAQLSRPQAPLPDDAAQAMEARLASVEASIEGGRDAILEAARLAAESAVMSFKGSEGDREAIAALASDLKSLENLARRSDDRNARTFEAIHDTLLKIVDRLSALENAPQQKMALASTPSIDASASMEIPGLQPAARVGARGGRSPAEAAAAAAYAALNEDAYAEPKAPAARRSSLLGGIARVFSGSRSAEKKEPTLAGDAAAAAEVTAPADPDTALEPKIANQPIEPGAGGPDLNAIMRRVRSERAENPAAPTERDAAKSDFIAAARRAAQAAAAEAETLKKGGSAKPAKSARFSFGAARRKPILMAVGAVMIAIAGFQLGKAFLAGGEQIAQLQPAPVVAKAVDEAMPAEAADDPAKETDAGPAAQPVEAETAPVVRAAAPSTPHVEGAEDAGGKTVVASANAGPTPQAAADPDLPPAAPVTEPLTLEDIPEEVGPMALRLAAAKNDPKALFEIGARYDEGRGVEQNRETAAKWYERAAEAGFAPAQYRIGSFHEKGIGVDLDLEKAKTWYQLAAAQGNASAMHNLAVLFAMGPDGTPDNQSAARWFLEAAELGVKDSQFNMGIMTAKGAGVPQSLEESYKWFALAAKQGDKDAAEKRDEVANALRPEQLEKARGTTELWKVKPIKPEANIVDIPAEWKDGEEHTASVDMTKAISNIQHILNKNGYDAGAPDGIMGARTKAAIAAFQKDVGLEPTGEVDEPLVRELLARK